MKRTLTILAAALFFILPMLPSHAQKIYVGGVYFGRGLQHDYVEPEPDKPTNVNGSGGIGFWEKYAQEMKEIEERHKAYIKRAKEKAHWITYWRPTSTFVVSSGSSPIKYYMKYLSGFGANSKGPWALVHEDDKILNIGYSYHPYNDNVDALQGKARNDRWSDVRKIYVPDSGWGTYTVMNGKDTYLTLSGVNENEGLYTSAAMRVKGNDVAVVAVKSKLFNIMGFESTMSGYVNKTKRFESESFRKSLKSKHFEGFSGDSDDFNRSPVHDTQNRSVPRSVKAVDYVDGNLFSTGWGEREYSDYKSESGLTKVYERRVPRAWMNDKETLMQFENQTGAAHAINIEKKGSKYIYHTSGHHRNKAHRWLDKEDVTEGKVSNTIVMAEAFSSDFSYACMVIGGEVYTAQGSSRPTRAEFGRQLFFHDVVYHSGSRKFYAVGVDLNKNTIEVYSIVPGSKLYTLEYSYTPEDKNFGCLKVAVY